jgi:hypothetical protein
VPALVVPAVATLRFPMGLPILDSCAALERPAARLNCGVWLWWKGMAPRVVFAEVRRC